MKYPVAKPYITDGDIERVTKVLKSGWLSLGPEYREFESKMSEYCESKYACAVSSGTAGLHLAVKVVGLKAGDEVITSPFSFISSSNCLLYEGVKPVFVDIDEETYNMDATKIEAAITSKTKAILVVHIFGQTADMESIMRIAKKHNLKVIEDACESLGSTYKGIMAGTFGDVGVYAFYPNKQMTTGEGGMIVTDDKEIYDLCSSLRNQGRNPDSEWLVHERIGYNYRMDEMSATLGVGQLDKIKWMIDRRVEIAEWYNGYLPEIAPKTGKYRNHTYFVYVVRVKNRDKVMEKLTSAGIQTKTYMPVIHLQPFMRKMFGYKEGDFPIAEKVSSETLALPFYIGLKREDIQNICSYL